MDARQLRSRPGALGWTGQQLAAALRLADMVTREGGSSIVRGVAGAGIVTEYVASLPSPTPRVQRHS